MTGATRQRIAAYALVVDDRDRVLLVLGGPADNDMWFLPGGGVDFGEHPEDGVRREMIEETGQAVHSLALRTILTDTTADGVMHTVRIIYDGQVDPEGELRPELDGSTVGPQWVRRREAVDLKLAPYVRDLLGRLA